MVRKMMKVSRKCLGMLQDGSKIIEPWLDWQKRSMSAAGSAIDLNKCSITVELTHARENWANDLARMGQSGKPMHMVKAVIMHRPVSWWRRQQVYNRLNEEPKLHRARMGYIRRWENHLNDNWVLKAPPSVG